MWTRIRELRKELPARWLLDLGHTALSLLLVAGITGLIGIALHFYKIDHVTILYLIPVLVAALHWGSFQRSLPRSRVLPLQPSFSIHRFMICAFTTPIRLLILCCSSSSPW
jgi:hypothetical protein